MLIKKLRELLHDLRHSFTSLPLLVKPYNIKVGQVSPMGYPTPSKPFPFSTEELRLDRPLLH